MHVLYTACYCERVTDKFDLFYISHEPREIGGKAARNRMYARCDLLRVRGRFAFKIAVDLFERWYIMHLHRGSDCVILFFFSVNGKIIIHSSVILR